MGLFNFNNTSCLAGELLSIGSNDKMSMLHILWSIQKLVLQYAVENKAKKTVPELYIHYLNKIWQNNLWWKTNNRLFPSNFATNMKLADDTILFCEATRSQLLHIQAIPLCFEAVSGLRVNLKKSELVLVGEVENIDELANPLCCKVGNFHMTYLGLPLGSGFKAVSALFWICPPISSLFTMPTQIANRLEGLQRNFSAWGDTKNNHLVNWEKVCFHMKEGLGVRKLSNFNKAY